uniref:protein-histidine N-methyltransferase n=1 Tax=Meloidogyne floridensis TaxID=298350 RepID=A0A915PEY3_9BILA
MATNILKLKSGRKIYYSTKESIENKLISNKIKLSNLTDLENKVYEGGLKIWECSLDLSYFIDSMSFEGFNVLELGCGAGLPSIVAALNGASSLTLQDFVFDIILTSETIYNEENYLDLLEIMNKLLNNEGEIYLAAKNYYFGLSGSIPAFQSLIETQGIFNCQQVWKTTKSSIERKILKIKRI